MVTRATALRPGPFLDRVAAEIGRQLPADLGPPTLRRRATLLQVSFGRPRLHYEVWLQLARAQVELGLHLEADPELNGWLLRRLAPEMPAVRGEVGCDIELEQWTESWGRIHCLLPISRLDETLAAEVAERLASTIACLEPRLREHLALRAAP